MSNSERIVKGILGTKLGMTQLWDENNKIVPVTVIQAGPCVVTQVRTPEKDGYSAVQLGFGAIASRKVTKPAQGHFDKAGVTPRRHLLELRTANIGDTWEAYDDNDCGHALKEESAEVVYKTVHQGDFRADNDETDVLLLGKLQDRRIIGDSDIRHLTHARIAWNRIYALCLRAFGELPKKSMLTAA